MAGLQRELDKQTLKRDTMQSQLLQDVSLQTQKVVVDFFRAHRDAGMLVSNPAHCLYHVQTLQRRLGGVLKAQERDAARARQGLQ